MRVLHNDERNESPRAQRAYEYSSVERREEEEASREEREEIDQVGIPLKQYPTSGSRTKVEEPEVNERNEDISIELRDHEEEDGDEHLREERRESGHAGANIEVTDADMASWVGQPAIKGSTESMRMALLTLSLIGLQYAPSPNWPLSIANISIRFTWGIEMTCKLPPFPPPPLIHDSIY